MAISESRKEELLRKVISADGDLSKLSQKEREDYYVAVCESLNLNPVTQPFNYLTLRDRKTGRTKLVLYAKRDCTDQLSSMQKLSRQIIEEKVLFDSIYTVTARVTSPDGRITENTGKVNIRGLAGDDLANALMKAETKAFRRAILGHCGLGFNDETEVETIPEAVLNAGNPVPPPEKTEAPKDAVQPSAAEAQQSKEAPTKEPPNGTLNGSGNRKKGSKKQEQDGSQEKPQPYEGTVVISGNLKKQNEYSGAEAVDTATDSHVFVLTKDAGIAAKLAPGAVLRVKGQINNKVVMIQEAEEIKTTSEPASQETAAEPEAPSEPAPSTEPEAHPESAPPEPETPSAIVATVVGDPKEAPYNGTKTLYVYGIINDEKVCLVGDALNGITAGSTVEVQGEWTEGRGNVKVLLISTLRPLESKVA
ncbi:MAG: hypothetical protein PWQ39_493 [Thermacetogenium sp.]|nr:hypothetical protein [Thermacetogenium sp.]